MICHKCNKGELKEQISIKGLFMKRKEIYTFCNLCNFQNKKEFKLSKEDVITEREKRVYDNEIELQRAKNIKETKYDQSYKRE